MDDIKVVSLVSEEEASEPEQMFLSFKRPYSDIALKEAVRGVKTITREAIRFGADLACIAAILTELAKTQPIISAAVDAIDEQLVD